MFLYQNDLLGQEDHFAQLCGLVLFIVSLSCTMSLQGCQIFKYIDSGNFPTDEANKRKRNLLIICTMNFKTPKLGLLWSIIRKFRPCCRNNSIFFLSVNRQVLLADVLLLEYVFERKEKARFLKTTLKRAAFLSVIPSLICL